MSLYRDSIPENVNFLCMLHNIGATRPERSLTLEEIAHWSSLDTEKVKENLEKLIDTNYVCSIFTNEVKRYHITVNGIRKVLSIYS